MILSSKLAPLIYANGNGLTISLSNRFFISESSIIFSMLITKDIINGSNFSVKLPLRNPSSSPFKVVTDFIRYIFLYLLFDFLNKPKAKAKETNVLPDPAGPVQMVISLSLIERISSFWLSFFALTLVSLFNIDCILSLVLSVISFCVNTIGSSLLILPFVLAIKKFKQYYLLSTAYYIIRKIFTNLESDSTFFKKL